MGFIGIRARDRGGHYSHFGINRVIEVPSATIQNSQISRGKAEDERGKMGGGMEYNKNKWIEEWGAARENLELNFRWTRRNLAIVGIFGIAIPVLVYKGIVKEFVSTSDFRFLSIRFLCIYIDAYAADLFFLSPNYSCYHYV